MGLMAAVRKTCEQNDATPAGVATGSRHGHRRVDCVGATSPTKNTNALQPLTVVDADEQALQAVAVATRIVDGHAELSHLAAKDVGRAGPTGRRRRHGRAGRQAATEATPAADGRASAR